jgi:hypothetical protein
MTDVNELPKPNSVERTPPVPSWRVSGKRANVRSEDVLVRRIIRNPELGDLVQIHQKNQVISMSFEMLDHLTDALRAAEVWTDGEDA